MPRSPFQIAFDHYEECSDCDYAARRLCERGRDLFRVAHDACVLLVNPEPPQTKNQA